MKFKIILKCLVFLAFLTGSNGSVACPLGAHGKALSKGETKKLKRNPSQSRRPNQVVTGPYGGSDSSKWTIESKLANTFKSEIELGLKKPDVIDVVVSIPLNITDGGWPQFGDGQTNSQPEFGKFWSQKEAPLIVRREFLKQGGHRDVITAHASLNVKDFESKQVGETLFVKPVGWDGWFAVSFKHQIVPVSLLKDHFPKTWKAPGQRPFPDPENIKSEQSGQSAYQTLFSHKFSDGYLGPYPPGRIPTGGVHDRFPMENGAVTAVGGMVTWMIEEGPVKHLYTCFAGRNLKGESDHGVPSGAGWHRVGTFSETILNTLEKSPILVALGKIVEDPTPNNAERAYGLGASVTARYLQPAEAFMTIRGQFHWYAIDSADEACTEILVHACVPDAINEMGMTCK